MYKPNEASKLLNIPESTLRRLALQFKDYLSPQTGRKRHYTQRDLSILQQARDMLESGLTVKLVSARLEKITELMPDEQPTEQEPEPDNASPVLNQLAVLDKQYSSLLSELERLRDERQVDRERLARLEAWLSLPWWRRLFTSPPQR